MQEEPLEATYFNWLCAKVLQPKIRNYWDLMQILNETEFVWLVPGDRNRAEDGILLRIEFLNMLQEEADNLWLDMPCSVLEMLIAFSRRAAFQTDIEPKEWFWIFLRNLNLEDYRRVGKSDVPVIQNILHTLVWRTYERDGYGGMFPLRESDNDQRRVEIWYQFCEYLDDQGLLFGLL